MLSTAQRRVARHHVRHRRLQVDRALADHVVHPRRRHAGLLQQTERLARLHRAQLQAVPNQHQRGNPERLQDALQVAHLHRPHHRGLVDHHDRIPEGLAGPGDLLLRSRPLGDVRVAGQQPLQGGGADATLHRENPRRRRGRGETEHPFARERRHLVQHPRLARPRETLHRHRRVLRQQHQPRGFLLAVRQGRSCEAPVDRLFRCERPRGADALPHAADHLLLGRQRPPRGQRALARLDQVAVPLQVGDLGFQLAVRVTARLAAQRRRQKVGLPEHRVALLQVVHRPPRRLQRREPGRRPREAPLRPVETHRVPVPRETLLRRPRLPQRRELDPSRLVLGPSRVEGRRLRGLRAVVPAPLRHVGEDVAAAGRERLQHRGRVARQLEARQPANLGRRQHVAHRIQPPREVVAVPRPDQAAVPLEGRRLDAPPLARHVPRHVGDHRVGVELRVVVAAGDVPEGRRHHAVRLHPGTPPGRRVVAPGLQELGLHPVERRAHRRVMRPQNRPVAIQERFQRHRLGGRERRVPARAVLVLPVHHPAEADLRPRHPALQDGDEPAPAHPLRQTQSGRSPAVPAVRRPVRVVVAHQVLVKHVRRRFRRRYQSARAGEHPSEPQAGPGRRSANGAGPRSP